MGALVVGPALFGIYWSFPGPPRRRPPTALPTLACGTTDGKANISPFTAAYTELVLLPGGYRYGYVLGVWVFLASIDVTKVRFSITTRGHQGCHQNHGEPDVGVFYGDMSADNVQPWAARVSA